jgi:hypothetical protein
MRADFRGLGRISVYQKMSLFALPYAVAVIFLIPATVVPPPSIIQGMTIFIHPIPMISLQILWMAIFFIFGRSTATSSTVTFHVVTKVGDAPFQQK